MAGINKLLYEKPITEPPKLLTREEIMDNMHIKDNRTFNQLIHDGMPHIKIGRKILVPLDKYTEWIHRHS